MSAIVPVISLAGPNAATQFDDAARNVGFLQIADHGIPDAVIENMLLVSDQFFARGLDEKKRFGPPSPEINRGYAAKGTEALAYSVGMEAPPDLFEAFNLGPDGVPPEARLSNPTSVDQYLDAPTGSALLDSSGINRSKGYDPALFFAANIWPEDQPEFRTAITEYFVHVRSLAHRLTDLFADALGLPEGHFRTYTDYSASGRKTKRLRLRRNRRPSGRCLVSCV